MEKELDKFLDKNIQKARASLIVYIAFKKGLTQETMDLNKIKSSCEYSNNSAITTVRYDGELWYQEFKEGKNRLNIRFKSPYIK
jgi:hypothetical protein